MLLIQLAEQYYNWSTIFWIQDFERSQGMSFKLRSTIYLLDQLSGFPTYTIFVNRRFAAISNQRGRLVAPITKTSPLFGLVIPSNNTRNYVFSRRDASFSFSDRAVNIESISSMKIILGAMYSAALNTLLNIFSDYPTSLFMIDEAERAKKVHSDSLARALQRRVFPFPGGPYRRSPLGGARMPVQRSGRSLGLITASSRMSLTSLSPTMSSKETSIFLTMRSPISEGTSSLGLTFCPSFFISPSSCFMSGRVGCSSETRLCCMLIVCGSTEIFGNPNLLILGCILFFSYCFCCARRFS